MTSASAVKHKTLRDCAAPGGAAQFVKDLCVNTVDEVERMTGYDFFPALPDSMEVRVEAYASTGEWR